MPELPEVEVFVRGLRSTVGASIRDVDVLDDRLDLDAACLRGAMISAVERRGKHIVIRLSHGGDLVIHLRMSGRLRLQRSEKEIRYTRLVLRLDSGDSIYFINPRRLGTVSYCSNGFQPDLGVEPLDPSFSRAVLAEMVSRSRSPIKLFLLDQRKIAGIGNIYASEALWRSAISPQRRANSLSREDIARLHDNIISVLNEAIAGQGTTLGTSISDYHPSIGEHGEFQNHLSVYGREAEPCERCGEAIGRVKQGGRSTYYCRNCQI